MPNAPVLPASKTPAPVAPVPVIQTNSLDTQDVEKMLDEEEEFYNVVEEREHNVGINDSIVDWYGVNFPSSITNTGESKNRTGPVIQPTQNCDDCKANSKTFDKQRQLLMNQDKQIQQSHQI